MKEKFLDLMQKNGVENIHQLAKLCGIESCNIYTNINGKTQLGVKRAFMYANAIGVPVEDVIAIFYPDDMKANRKACKKK